MHGTYRKICPDVWRIVSAMMLHFVLYFHTWSWTATSMLFSIIALGFWATPDSTYHSNYEPKQSILISGRICSPVGFYEVCLKSNETGAIKFFMNNWTSNQHYSLQNSSLGKPHTAGDIAPTPGSNAGSLHVEVLSANVSQPFVCCPQFQNDKLWGGIWVSGKLRSHTDSDQTSMGAAELLEYPFC